MTRWQDYVHEQGDLPDWPDAVNYGKEQEFAPQTKIVCS
jgi:hypothetical protein